MSLSPPTLNRAGLSTTFSIVTPLEEIMRKQGGPQPRRLLISFAFSLFFFFFLSRGAIHRRFAPNAADKHALPGNAPRLPT